MREDLVRLLQERVGLSREQAERAADVVVEYVKQRGPELLRGLTGGQGGIGGILGR